jgi:hypothetical protein
MQVQVLRAIALAILVGAAIASAAQTDNKITVSGTIHDPSGAVVSNAQIVVQLKQCKCPDCKPPDDCDCCPNQLTAKSREDGTFTFSVPHGKYHVEVSAGGRKGELNLDLDEGDTKTASVTVQ